MVLPRYGEIVNNLTNNDDMKTIEQFHNPNLSKREMQIAELLAWGDDKKGIATRLFISIRTVENHTRNIYEKLHIQKVNELSAWWFCTRFGISFDLSPLKRSIISIVLLLIMFPDIFLSSDSIIRSFRSRTSRTTSMARRVGEREGETFELKF